MKKLNFGFSAVELMIAIGLSSIVLTVSTMVIYNLFAENRGLEVWSSGQLEMSLALKVIEGDIRNVIRLDPVENLTTSADPIYFGMTSLAVGMQPSVCLNGNGASVIRFTSLERKQRSEQVLRAWSETGDGNLTGTTHELRVTADTTTESMFGPKKAPREIVLLDADRRYLRRYRVVSYRVNQNTPLDPYDDKPKMDAYGKPMRFTYASVHLATPNNVNGTAITSKTAVFVTQSEAYESHTYIVCLRRTDRSLIRYDESTGEQFVLLQNPHPDFILNAFTVSYLATRKDIRVEPANFIPEILSLTNKECINTVLFDINLQASASFLQRNRQKVVGEIKTEISRQRAVHSQNLNIKRPLSCDVVP